MDRSCSSLYLRTGVDRMAECDSFSVASGSDSMSIDRGVLWDQQRVHLVRLIMCNYLLTTNAFRPKEQFIVLL